MFKYFVVIFLCIYSTWAAHLPSEIVQRQCRLNDPDLNACILKRARELLPTFCKGIPSAGIPSFDPLHLKQLEFSSDEPNLNIYAKLNEVTLLGHKSAIIRNITLNPDTLKGFAIIQIPKILMRSNMAAKGRINDFNLDNHAIYNWEFSDIKYAFKYQLKTGRIDNVLHYSIDTLDLLSSAGDAHLELESVNQANQIQDTITAAAFNANPQLVLNHPQMKKFMSKSTASIYKSVINYILHKIPAKEFLIQ